MATDKHRVRLALTPAASATQDAGDVIQRIRDTLADYGVDVNVTQDGGTYHVDVDVDAMEAVTSAVDWVLQTAREAIA